METKKATIRRETDRTSLILEGSIDSFEIILTDDNPNNIKTVFNNLLKELKKGMFIYVLEDEVSDLTHNICIEYLSQLNSELQAVFDELSEYQLLQS